MKQTKLYLCTIGLFVLSCSTSFSSERISLPATGSTEPAHTVFTSPSEDPSTAMNVSWATDPAVFQTYIEYTKASDTAFSGKRIVFPSETRLSTSFDSIHSKLADNSDVYERHVFKKQGATLTGLEPDTRYVYRVVSRRDGQLVKTDERSFKTAGADAWKAAVIGDYHHYSPLWSRLDHATAMVDVLDSVAGGFDWILSTGDQAAWGASYNYWTELAEQPMYKKYTWGAVEGNHDHWAREKKDYSDEYFRDTHYNPMNGYAGQEGIVYWFKWGDVLFIMLNNEAMRNQQTLEVALKWMEDVVAHNPSRYIVVVEHYEWLIGTNGANSQLDRFASTFDRLGVDLALSGNNHVYLRTHPLFDRKPVAPGEGTVYVVNSSSDNSRGRDLKPLEANEDIIATRWSEGPKTVGGMILDVDSSRMILTLYDRTGSAVDSVTVPARR
ncbi:MAG: metallophosphoesterase family protein [Muribaculaceae bacterium]|nr:metallophosphoesterase family protein [Muribaculaceae bacterium]